MERTHEEKAAKYHDGPSWPMQCLSSATPLWRCVFRPCAGGWVGDVEEGKSRRFVACVCFSLRRSIKHRQFIRRFHTTEAG